MKKLFVRIEELLMRLFRFEPDGDILDDADDCDCGPVMWYIKPDNTRISKEND